MIHSARLIVMPVASIVFCCFVFLDLKSKDWLTDGRTTCAKTMIPTARDFGLAEWINFNNFYEQKYKLDNTLYFLLKTSLINFAGSWLFLAGYKWINEPVEWHENTLNPFFARNFICSGMEIWCLCIRMQDKFSLNLRSKNRLY